MKKITALVTTLFLGLSGAAMADTGRQFHGPAEQAPIAQPTYDNGRDHHEPIAQPAYGDNGPMVRDHGDGDRQAFRPVAKSWVALASNSSLMRGKDIINVSTLARFSTLKLEASRGSLQIDKVVITFANGQKQIVQLDKTLGRRDGSATIDLQGRSRQITKVVVSGRGNFRSSFSLLAV